MAGLLHGLDITLPQLRLQHQEELLDWLQERGVLSIHQHSCLHSPRGLKDGAVFVDGCVVEQQDNVFRASLGISPKFIE